MNIPELLAAALPQDCVTTEAWALQSYGCDRTTIWPAHAVAVVRPRHIDEVVEEKTALEAKLLRQQDAHEANRAALSSMSKARDGAEELVLSLRSSQDGLRQQCAQLTVVISAH